MCGGSNPVSVITDPISSALGTDGGGGGLLGGLADLDKTINNAVPGGWITVGALTTGGLALAYAPEVMAFAESMGVSPEVASASLNVPPVNAATGEVISLAPDYFAGLSANAPVDASLSQAAASSMANGAGAFTDANLGYTGAAQELGLEGSSTGLTDLSGTQGSAMLDSMGLNTSGLSANDVLNGLSKANQVKNLATTGYNLINGPTASTLKTGLDTFYGTGAGTGTGALTNTNSDIVDLKPGLTKGSAFKFASTPSFTSQPAATPTPQQQISPLDYALIQNAATGGLIHSYAEGESVQTPSQFLKPQTLHGQSFRSLSRFAPAQFGGYRPREFAEGGAIPEGHDPTFFSEGGLNSLENTYVKGPGDGTSDSVAAMLANGEFVVPADVVSKLGNGSNDAGADALSQMLVSIRKHAQQHDPEKLPPKSKNPLAYLLDAKRKVG